MSRPPNPRSSHGRSPSVEGEIRRASTHSLNLSYAYGAPASSPRVGTSSSAGLQASPPRRARSSTGAVEEEDEGELEAREPADTGRAAEPAAVRYARLAQRKKDTGGNAYPPPPPVAYDGLQNTSVNIANAFKAATSGLGGVVVGGRREDFPPLNGPIENGAGEAEEADEEQDLPQPAKAPPSAGKKRKKHAPKDPTYRHQAGQTSSSEESEFDQRAKGKKRTKPADPSYNPTKDPSYHAGNTSTAESENGANTKRRKSKGKGRASTGGRSAAQEAIPRGIRDGEIWYGKKRKSKRGSRRSTAGAEGEEQEDEEDEEENGFEYEGEDLGGMDPQDHPAGDDYLDDDEADRTPPAASYFLRLRSPSPRAKDAASTSQQQVAAPSSRSNGAGPADPAFAAFDHSLGHGNDSNSLSASFDNSVLRRSSYDYSEEERIVQALEAQRKRQFEEEQRRRHQAQPTPQQQRVAAAATPGTSGATPMPTTGAYPPTPGAAASPVSALRKRRLPGPPSMLGAGPPLGSIDDDEDDVARAERMGGEWGRNRSKRSADSSPSSSPSYIAPSVAPESLEGLIARLSDLESAMSRLSSASDSDRRQSSDDRGYMTRLSEQLESLETTLSTEQARAKAALASLEKSGESRSLAAEKAAQDLKGDIDSLQARIRSLTTEQQRDASDLRHLQTTVTAISRDVAELDQQISKVAKDVAAATDVERITRIALDAIAKKLPGKVAVRLDDSGRLEIDPAFWRVLKDAFVDKPAVERTVDAKIAAIDGSKRNGLFGSSKEAKGRPAPPSWDDFLATNEGALKAWVASDLSSRTGSDAFVSKKTFLDLLRREIKLLKRDFEAKANENFEQMGQEILAKVAKQEDMRRKDASLASHLNPFARHHSAPAADGPVTIKSSDGQNVTAIISSLVDSALLRYSKDVLARPDYALYTAGGRVIRSLTSRTYEPHPLSRSRSLLAWVTGTSVPQGRSPVTALHPDRTPGSCWPFAGQHGQIGVQLSRCVVPTDITLEHISPDVALDGDVSSAPKDFEVWGIVDGPQNVAKVAQFRLDEREARRAARSAGQDPLDDIDATENEPTSIPPSANHILLAVGSYDPSAPSPVQSFPVTPAARRLAIPIQVVVVKVLSNHGESAYTCLYRIRVGGRTESQLLDASA
ncbi:spindle pole body-associated protein sad1 [Rhodotorula toruloides]|uniref:Spindle pole body-associated protein sad1 n=1 Tax=Rhodotorula toruloides TaxID=5286 RepID=A0A511K9J6_RHOTO|nr:spindle pole body-associated protein sad1 [Rhodotorula toruloides]